MAIVPPGNGDLYALLLKFLPTATYMAAMRADPLLWRRIVAKKLPRPAQLFRKRLKRKLKRHCTNSDVVKGLLSGLDSGELYLLGECALSLLNDHSDGLDLTIGRNSATKKPHLFADLLGIDRITVLRQVRADIVPFSNQIGTRFELPTGGGIVFYELNGDMKSTLDDAILPLHANLYSRGSLVVKHLDAVLQRRCVIQPSTYA